MWIKWIKPNGNEIVTNDEKGTIEHCESVGWKEIDREKFDAGKIPIFDQEQIEAQVGERQVLNSRDDAPVYDPGIEEADVAPPKRKAGKVKSKK